MNADSEQIAPAVDVAPRSGHNVLGWFLAVMMAVVWYAFWGFWLSPIEPVTKAGISGAPAVSFLSGSGNSAAADARAVWSPWIFSLPSEAGFSRGALTNRIGGRPPLEVPGRDALFLAPPSIVAAESGFRFAPDLEDSVREALPNLPDRLSESCIFGDTASTGTGVQVELASGLERTRFRTMDVPQDDVLLKDKPWEVTAFVEFNNEGKVSRVFMEAKSSFDDVDAVLVRSLWRWQVDGAKEPLSGRVTFRSPGRPQVAGELQNRVGP
jgi:hypothetical protein